MKYVVTTIYKGQRKFLYCPERPGKELRALQFDSVAIDAVEYARCFDNIDDAAEAAGIARASKRWRGWSWHEAVHPLQGGAV